MSNNSTHNNRNSNRSNSDNSNDSSQQALEALTLYRQFQQQRHYLSEQAQTKIHDAANDFLASLNSQASSQANTQTNTSKSASNSAQNTQQTIAPNTTWWQKVFTVSPFATPQPTMLAMMLFIVIGGGLLLNLKPFSSNSSAITKDTIWESDTLANCYSCEELATLSATALRGTLPNTKVSAAVRARQLGRLAASLALLSKLPENNYQTKSINKSLNRAILISQASGFNELQQSLLSLKQGSISPTARDSVRILENFFQNSAQQNDFLLGKDLETLYISSLSHQQDNNPVAIQKALKTLTELSTRLEQNNTADVEQLIAMFKAAQGQAVISQQQAGNIAQQLNTVITALTR